MDIQKLFNYRPNGNDITLNDGETTVNVRVIRKGPRGIVAMVKGIGPLVLWDKSEADGHVNDSETDLLNRIKTVIG